MQAASNHHTYLDISKYNYDSGHIDDKNISNTFGTLQVNYQWKIIKDKAKKREKLNFWYI